MNRYFEIRRTSPGFFNPSVSDKQGKYLLLHMHYKMQRPRINPA